MTTPNLIEGVAAVVAAVAAVVAVVVVQNGSIRQVMNSSVDSYSM